MNLLEGIYTRKHQVIHRPSGGSRIDGRSHQGRHLFTIRIEQPALAVYDRTKRREEKRPEEEHQAQYHR